MTYRCEEDVAQVVERFDERAAVPARTTGQTYMYHGRALNFTTDVVFSLRTCNDIVASACSCASSGRSRA